jgi:PAS domain S-box-containing protein
MLGGEPANLIGRSFLDFVCKDRNRLELEDVELADANSQTISRDLLVSGAGGRDLWVRAQIGLAQGGQGHLVPTSITLTDIDDLMLGAGHVSLNPQALDRLFGAAPEVIWLTRQQDHQIIYINEAYERVWGRSREALLRDGREWLEGVHPEDRERVARESNRLRALGLPLSIEYRLARDDGSVCWILDQAFPIHDARGEVLVYMGGALNVTEHKQNEIRLAQMQSANNIGSIAADLAHNFNNLLAIIDLSARSVARKLDVAPVQPKFEAIHAAVARGNEITRSLLAISSRQLLHPVELNLNDAIMGVSQLAAATVGPNITLDYVLTPLCCQVKIDRSGFSQALVNLLTNAREAMGEVGEITIGTRVVDRALGNGATQAVEVFVEDNGPGMADAVLLKACDPYFTTKAEGSGLGLAITQGFVKQSGGVVELANRSGGGLAVRMLFPRVGTGRAGEAGGNSAPSSGKVLLVDDEPEICDLIRDLLGDAGFQVIAVQSAACARSVLEQSRFDLLITDLALNTPVSGVELAQIARGQHPEMPILAITGYAGLAGKLPAGCAVVAKPFEPEEFVRRVKQLVAGAAG